MVLSMNASLLLVGTATGQVHVYDIASHQLLRSINAYKDKGLEITYLASFLKPLDLFGHVSLTDGGVSIKDTEPVRPIAPFQKTKDPVARASHEIPLMLPIQASVILSPSYSHPLSSLSLYSESLTRPPNHGRTPP